MRELAGDGASGRRVRLAMPPKHLRRGATGVAVAVSTLVLAYGGGAYDLGSRSALAIGTWWAVVVTVGLGIWPAARIPKRAIAVGGLFAAYTAYTLLSSLWAAAPEHAVTEFNRAGAYLGVFVLALIASTRATTSPWVTGLGFGIAAIASLALMSRLFAILDDGTLGTFLPSSATRLSFPLGYWNGLAIFVAIGVPLLLRIATSGGRVVASIALATFPAIGAVIYLASSRGGVATAAVGAVTFVALSRRRWAAVAAAAVGLGGAAAGVAALLPHHELVNGPLDSAAAAEQGTAAAVSIALIAVACAFAAVVGAAAVARVRPPRTVGWVLVAAVSVGCIALFFKVDPEQRFQQFKQPPADTATFGDDFVRAHLLSGGGSGRWQLWGSAIEQWQTAPLHGRGAGSFESWWAERGTIQMFARDAHSLYLETLGELGVLGFALLVAALAVGIVSGVSLVRAAPAGAPDDLPALVAVVVAFAFAAGIDWVWELTAVSAVAIAALGLIVSAPPLSAPPTTGRERQLGLGVAVIGIGWVLLVSNAGALLTDVKLRDSTAAATTGELARADADATTAAAISPWSAAPQLQRSLVAEARGDLGSARVLIEDALKRDPRDWRLWLVAARLEAKSGDVDEARRSLSRARELNPRSPLFRQ